MVSELLPVDQAFVTRLLPLMLDVSDLMPRDGAGAVGADAVAEVLCGLSLVSRRDKRARVL